MEKSEFSRLAGLLREERAALLAAWRAEVRKLPAAQELDRPTIDDHIPALLDELADALDERSDETIAETLLVGTPPEHGRQRLYDGFDIAEVVAEYNILRGCVHDLAEAHGLPMVGMRFHIVNRVLDEAIALAVKSFATQSAFEIQKRRDQYLAFVAHDLRTPLNAVALAARVLDRFVPSDPPDAPARRMVRALNRNVQRLGALVEAVLKENTALLSRDELHVERRILDLWSFVESLFVDLEVVATTAGVELINAVPEELIIYADAGMLRRIIQNLVANGIKNAPSGVVSVEAQQASAAIKCTVRDNGRGIEPDRLARIFDGLESDDADAGGTGLGLTIVKTYVEAHGGTLHAESSLGAGASVSFSLPDAP